MIALPSAVADLCAALGAIGGVEAVDALLGYLAGVPTYSLMAELALNRVVAGAGGGPSRRPRGAPGSRRLD